MEHVIQYIRRHLDEPLSLEQIAKYAAYSPFHFTRIFKQTMGVPPHYYVSSLRLQKAKHLLLNTNLSVRDIALEVGQQSLGTFTTRFTKRVGVSPAVFREQVHIAEHHLHTLQQLKQWEKTSFNIHPPATNASVAGTLYTEFPFEGIILVGLFPKPIPEGFPIHGTIVPALGEFHFSNVQPGIYYLMATTVSWNMNAKEVLLPNNTLRTRSREPIIVQPNSDVPHQHVFLYPPRIDDPPILISLPSLMRRFQQRMNFPCKESKI